MIQELFSWLTTRCAPQARQFGYLYEAIAMRARAKRCAAAWQSHLISSQQFISDCILKSEPGGVALVFGSGLGLDMPKAQLLKHFDEVWLVDMVHLRETRHAWQDEKVKFIEYDVTNTLSSIARGELTMSQPYRWLDDKNIRFVLSANIIGQLPVQPLSWLAKHYPNIEDEVLDAWSESLLTAHMTYLQAFISQGAHVCLIADLEWHYAENNQVRTVIDAWRGLAHPTPHARWGWRIAPRGELRTNNTQTNWVGAWCFTD
ncbi:MAG: hypothetical protein K0U21_05735 [Proteobacteria bacterium]|nr:hypothetical protein [Pseudomonadota bacterium]